MAGAIAEEDVHALVGFQVDVDAVRRCRIGIAGRIELLNVVPVRYQVIKAVRLAAIRPVPVLTAWPLIIDPNPGPPQLLFPFVKEAVPICVVKYRDADVAGPRPRGGRRADRDGGSPWGGRGPTWGLANRGRRARHAHGGGGLQ